MNNESAAAGAECRVSGISLAAEIRTTVAIKHDRRTAADRRRYVPDSRSLLPTTSRERASCITWRLCATWRLASRVACPTWWIW